MYFFNGLAYIVVNNSNKIEVVNANTFVSVATITGFNSPRYFLPVSNSKAYVTDLYDDAISIVDLSSNQRTGEIACAGWTEELVLAYGKAFVTNRERNQLYIINTMNDQLTDSIEIGAGANSIIEDRNGKLWVLCSGSNSNNINATLHRINPIENTVEISFTFNLANDLPRRLNINGTNDTLYFLNEGVVQMPINANALPSTTLIPTDGRNFYGLGIHPQTKEILVADAIDYVQRGKIYVYQANGTLAVSEDFLRDMRDYNKMGLTLYVGADSMLYSHYCVFSCIVAVHSNNLNIANYYFQKQKIYDDRYKILENKIHKKSSNENLNNMIKDLNVDHMKITIKPSVFRKIRKKCFLRQGEPNWAEHCAMFSSVVNTALIYEVPLVVWGEDIAFELTSYALCVSIISTSSFTTLTFELSRAP